MSQTVQKAGGALVLVGSQTGHTVIPTPTPLTRLNYFDGKFLRADDLRIEQQYLRALVGLSNQAGGAGVVHGFDTTLGAGDSLALGPGLAIDPAGRVLLLPQQISVSVEALIEASRRRMQAVRPQRIVGAEFAECEEDAETPPSDGPRGSDLYLITVGHAEALCGEEDVYGKLCEEACITSTDRPFRVEGLVVRALPLVLQTPLATSRVVTLDRRHLRSLVASAYFMDETRRVGHLISRDGLSLDTWCLGADAPTNGDVPLGVLARAGDTTVFLDAWTARRERIEPPPQRYWAWRMRMRPWDVFLAHVLQFQCHLRDVLEQAPEPGAEDDPCVPQVRALSQASEYLAEIEHSLTASPEETTGTVAAPTSLTAASELLPGGIQRIIDLNREVVAALQAAGVRVEDRILIRRGIVELPSAGYLPVVPGTSISVNTQVRRLVGEGLDLRFCVVRPDFVAHALEEAQHMERISLLRGLDNPGAREAVDVLVPDGNIVASQRPPGVGFDTRLTVVLPEVRLETPSPAPGTVDNVANLERARLTARAADGLDRVEFRGPSRAEGLSTGGGAVHFAGMAAAPQRRAAEEAEPAPAEPGGEVPTPPVGTPGSITGTPVRGMSFAEPVFTSRGRETTGAARATLGPRAFVAAVPPEDNSISGWATMRCDRNPFTLGLGETTRLVGEAALATAGRDRSVGIDVSVDGTLYVAEPARSITGTRRVRGRITRGRASITPVVNGVTGETQTAIISLDAELALTLGAAGGSTLEITLRHADGFEVTVQSGWSGDPLTATLDVRAGRETEDPSVTTGPVIGPAFSALAAEGDEEIVQVASARAIENPEVFAPDNALHTLALTALSRIERALRQPGFRTSAEAVLFPAVRPPEVLIVNATRDWVLFHRRRDKQCAPLERPVAPPRRFQLYHVSVAGPDELGGLREALGTGLGLEDFDFRAVAVTDFAAASATLLTDAAVLREAWLQASPGNRLPYGAVANESSAVIAEGAELARDRLRELALSLEPVTTVEPEAAFDVLAGVPSPLSPAGTDGMMLLVTRTVQVAEVCHDVLRTDDAEWAVFTEDLAAGNIAGATAILNRIASTRRLGDVRFEAGTPNIIDESGSAVAEAWNEAVGVPPAQVAVLLLPQQTADDAHAEQAGAISALLDSTATPGVIDLTETQMELVGLECPMVTVLVASEAEPVTRFARMVAVAGTHENVGEILGSEPSWTVEFNQDGTLSGALSDETVTGLERVVEEQLGGGLFSSVTLATRETAPDDVAATRLDSIYDAVQDFLMSDANGQPTAQKLISGRDGLDSSLQEFFEADGATVDDLVILARFIVE